jgi:hypothetical protein
LFLNDGTGYKEIDSSGGSSSGGVSSNRITLYGVPHYDKYNDLYIDEDEGVVVLTRFSKQMSFSKYRKIGTKLPYGEKKVIPWSDDEPLKSLSYESLPDWDVISHIVKDNQGSLYCFFRKMFDRNYDMSVKKIVDGKAVVGVIETWDVYRDGGTTYSKTSFGDFYFPTPFNKELKPTLNEEIVEDLDVTDKHYALFELKMQQKTLEDVWEDKIKSMENRCSARLEKEIKKMYGDGFWYSDEYKKDKILSKHTIFEFEQALDQINEF